MKIKTLLAIIYTLFLMVGIASADDEEITLTTYYPAPYGEYEELSTNKLAIGPGATMPENDGVISFSPLTSGLGGTAPTEGNLGDIYFDGTDKEFKYWKQEAASGSFKSLSGETSNQAICFFVHRNNVDQAVAKETHTRLMFTHQVSNVSGGFQLVDSKFVAPEDGYYVFTGSVYIGNIKNEEDFGLEIYKNENRLSIPRNDPTESSNLVCRTWFRASVGAGSGDGCVITTPPIYMNGSTDYLALYVWLDDNANRTVEGNLKTWFGGYKIGE
jgi:hypothetical protein